MSFWGLYKTMKYFTFKCFFNWLSQKCNCIPFSHQRSAIIRFHKMLLFLPMMLSTLFLFCVHISLSLHALSLSLSFFLSHILPSPNLICLSLFYFFPSLSRYFYLSFFILWFSLSFLLSLSPSISLIFYLPDSLSFYSDLSRKVKWYVWVTIRISKIKPILSSLLKWKTAIPL